MNEIEKLWERCGIEGRIVQKNCQTCKDYSCSSLFCHKADINTLKECTENNFIHWTGLEKEYPKFTLEHRNALEEMLTNFEVSVGVDYVKYLVRNINSSFIATYDKTRDQAICALVNELLDNGILTVKEVKDILCTI